MKKVLILDIFSRLKDWCSYIAQKGQPHLGDYKENHEFITVQRLFCIVSLCFSVPLQPKYAYPYSHSTCHDWHIGELLGTINLITMLTLCINQETNWIKCASLVKKRIVLFFLWFVPIRVCSSSRNKLVQLESRPTNIMQVPNQIAGRNTKTCRHSEPNKPQSIAYLRRLWVMCVMSGLPFLIMATNSS